MANALPDLQPPWPPTVVIMHPKEKRAKCSLEPLRGRADLSFQEYHPHGLVELSGYVRLAIDGPALSAADCHMGILLIDGAWRHAEKIQKHMQSVPARSLDGFRSAYPRVSKLFQDPASGLASIEALFIAYKILGRPTDGLLDRYHWRDAFLRINNWDSFGR